MRIVLFFAMLFGWAHPIEAVPVIKKKKLSGRDNYPYDNTTKSKLD